MGHNQSKINSKQNPVAIRSDTIAESPISPTSLNIPAVSNDDLNNQQMTNCSPPHQEAKELTCNICWERYMSNEKDKYVVAYTYVGVCQTCDIKNGTSYEHVKETNYKFHTKCEDCKRLTQCCSYAVFRTLTGLCNNCMDSYASDNEPKICFKGINRTCDVCKKNPSLKDKCYYTEPNDQNFCIKCLVLHKATRKQLIANIHRDKITVNLFHPLALHDKYKLISTYNEWTCTDANCNHPACNWCKEKHTILCKMTVYDNRVDMCQACWINFNKTTAVSQKDEKQSQSAK